MKVKFIPQNVEFEIKSGQSVMHVAQDHNIYIKSVCKGVPSCAECRVRVVDGEHNVLPPGSEELALIGTGHFIDRRRLSCQLKCFGDITVDMSEQIAKEQGLITGQKKKKLAVKDDRIEDATAIRASVPDGDDEPVSDTAADERPSAPSREPSPARGPQRETRPQAQGSPQKPAPGRSHQLPSSQRAPQKQTSATNETGGGADNGDRKRRRRRRGGRGGGGREGGSGGSSGGPSAPRTE